MKSLVIIAIAFIGICSSCSGFELNIIINPEDKDTEYLEETQDEGIKNCLIRAKAMLEVQYTLLSDLPIQNYDKATAGTTIKGLPYSSVREHDRFIGQNVSIYTFLTALKNPNSDIYKKISTTSNSKCWNGVVCSSFIGYIYDLPFRPTTREFRNLKGCHEKPFEELELCDYCLYRPDWDNDTKSAGHIVLVTNVEWNSDKKIERIELSEAKPPFTTKRWISYETLIENYKNIGYKAFSHPDLSKIKYDEDLVELACNNTYFDDLKVNICTNYGDKATIWADDSLVVSPINIGSATTIEVYYNDILTTTLTKVEEFTMKDMKPGMYKAVMNDYENSTTSWIVCDAQVERDGTTIKFHSEYCTPLYLSFNDTTGGSFKSFVFTNEDVTNGYFNTEYNNSNAPIPKVYFTNEYGTLGKIVK